MRYGPDLPAEPYIGLCAEQLKLSPHLLCRWMDHVSREVANKVISRQRQQFYQALPKRGWIGLPRPIERILDVPKRVRRRGLRAPVRDHSEILEAAHALQLLPDFPPSSG